MNSLVPNFASLCRAKCTVQCTFSVQCDTHFGEEVRVVGNCDSLGQWNPNEGLEMHWTDGHRWVATTTGIPTDQIVEFKYVLMAGGKVKQWEPFEENRIIMAHRNDPSMILANIFGDRCDNPCGDGPCPPELPEEFQEEEVDLSSIKILSKTDAVKNGTARAIVPTARYPAVIVCGLPLQDFLRLLHVPKL
eukprot:gnl/MRDRNA2_/MRDRNA2_126630_c0_seq1.p1 gnl/MRDRNA2_/MRDRNA2_126630_c0~~gnl/MRDRNA2_/MRDRNA2_126630_c0_seq1.p1  ORF type:complete len:191 (-),score=29.81 gnl/MRDRNA2_/MRDRNA2_126630_c0_seq1:74-646(-)